MIYDVTINEEPRTVLGHFGRNGFYYTLDRTNGSFISAAQYVKNLNWTKGIVERVRSIKEAAAICDGQPSEHDIAWIAGLLAALLAPELALNPGWREESRLAQGGLGHRCPRGGRRTRPARRRIARGGRSAAPRLSAPPFPAGSAFCRGSNRQRKLPAGGPDVVIDDELARRAGRVARWSKTDHSDFFCQVAREDLVKAHLTQ